MGVITVKVGNRYERMIVISESDVRRNPRERMVLCLCDCGTEKLVTAASLSSGNTKSCGCLNRERATERGRNSRTHGKTSTLTHRSWLAMRERCLTKTHRQYPMYGGRGIAIAPRWQDFEAFLADVGERPSREHTLDRWPNNNGNYEPGNVRWATKKQQSRNTRSNVILTFDGRSMPIAAWAEELGLNHSTLCERIRKGWSDEKAITTQKRRYANDGT